MFEFDEEIKSISDQLDEMDKIGATINAKEQEQYKELQSSLISVQNKKIAKLTEEVLREVF